MQIGDIAACPGMLGGLYDLTAIEALVGAQTLIEVVQNPADDVLAGGHRPTALNAGAPMGTGASGRTTSGGGK